MQAVIFDFDGVLVDSEAHWQPSMAVLCRRAVPEWNDTDTPKLMGLSVTGTERALRNEYGMTLSSEEFTQLIDAIAEDIYRIHCSLLPGVRELLTRLRDQGMPIGLASSSRRVWVKPTLERLGIHDFFDVIVVGDDVGSRGKPDPFPYLLAAERLGLQSTACTAIEDSANGIRSAKSAGMRCIAIQSDMNEEQNLKEADIIVKTIHEAHRYILSR